MWYTGFKGLNISLLRISDEALMAHFKMPFVLLLKYLR
jgi:hypothetical protein